MIQIYNNLQVLWNSEVKFVSLSQLLGCPLCGYNSGLFPAPGFIVSLLRIKKKRRRGRKRNEIKRERKEEGIKKEKRNERKKELKKLLKKNNKSPLLASDQPSQLYWSSWLQQAEGKLVLLFSLPELH